MTRNFGPKLWFRASGKIRAKAHFGTGNGPLSHATFTLTCKEGLMFSQATVKVGLDSRSGEDGTRGKAYLSPSFTLHQESDKSSAHSRPKHLKIVFWEDYEVHQIMTKVVSATSPQ